MSIRCPDEAGTLAVTMTRECAPAKFQMLSLSVKLPSDPPKLKFTILPCQL